MSRIAFILFFLLLSPLFCFAQTASATDPALTYYQATNTLPAEEKLAYAISALDTSADDRFLREVWKDLDRLGTRLGPDAPLPAIESFLTKVQEGSTQYQYAYLLRARFLMLTGKAEDATPMFHNAIQKRWKSANKDGFRLYAQTLGDCNRPAQAAIEEYSCIISDANPLPDGETNFLTYFFYWAWEMKRKNVDSSAMQDIYPYLPENPQHPEFKEIGQAFCLTADRRYSDAVTLFINTLSNLTMRQSAQISTSQESGGIAYDETLNIPLYIATALYLEGSDLNRAASYLTAFVTSNMDRPAFVVNSVPVIVHRLESMGGDYRQRIAEVTEALIRTGLLDDPDIIKQIPPEILAHFLDVHQMGLFAQGRWQEAKRVCEQLVEGYFPTYGPGVNGLFSLAMIHELNERDYEAAEAAYQRIITDSYFDDWRLKALNGLYRTKQCLGASSSELLTIVQQTEALASDPESKRILHEIAHKMSSQPH